MINYFGLTLHIFSTTIFKKKYMNWLVLIFWLTFTLIMLGAGYLIYLIFKKYIQENFIRRYYKKLKNNRIKSKIIKSLKLYKSKNK